MALSILRRFPEGIITSRSSFAEAAPFARSYWEGLPDEQFVILVETLLGSGLAEKLEDGRIALTRKGSDLVDESRQQRLLLNDQFRGQVLLDFQRAFPAADKREAQAVYDALESALVEAFRKRGLEIANFIVRDEYVRISDASDLFRAFKDASASLSTYEMRYYLIKYATNFLLKPNVLQKRYLWHLSQGYFAYHALNLDPKWETFRESLLAQAVWVIDSSVLIPLIAKGSMNHKYALDLFSRMQKLGLKTVTTTRILDEVATHARWADIYVRENGDESPQFLKAALAMGGVKQNLFIDGYIQSRVDGGCVGFQEYMSDIFGSEDFLLALVRKLGHYNVQTLNIQEWPGFETKDWAEIEEYTRAVTEIRKTAGTFRNEGQCIAEAEVFVALLKEAVGQYSIRGKNGPWAGEFFVSQSGVLNAIQLAGEKRKRVAWKPEALYRFLLCFPIWAPNEDYLQQCMLSEFFTAGIEIVDQKRYSEYFGSLIRQSRLTFPQVMEHYRATIEQKFPAGVEEAFNRTPDLQKPFFALQMATQTARLAAQSVTKLREEARFTSKEKKELEFLRSKHAKKRKKGPRSAKKKR